MKIIRSVQEFINLRQTIKASIGFVPTMGALHKAHESLISRSIQENDISVVSIFVNPTQFNDKNDLKNYPRPIKYDIQICENLGVDYLFLPDSQDIYKDKVEIPHYDLSLKFEGKSRPGHFDGVLQIVLRLFKIIKPSKAYFGQKDAQQLALIQNMVKDLLLNIEIIPCKLIREENGLAMSSRNTLLSKEDINKAVLISKALLKVKDLTDINLIKNTVNKILDKEFDIEYVEVLRRDFSTIKEVEIGNSIILVAAKIGNIRLIDNILV